MTENVIETYSISADGVAVEINVIKRPQEFTKEYFLNIPEYGRGTEALLHNLREILISSEGLGIEKANDPKFVEQMKIQFREKAEKILTLQVPNIETDAKNFLVTTLLYDMFGLGQIEFLLSDGNLEEIVVNESHDPLWVYHKKYGWLKTNIFIQPEEQIENYANIIARRIGKQITTLDPLLDAHLLTGDRANATLFPISGKGNTITIRRFRRDPWTMVDLIKNNTLNEEIAALLWEAVQYELNVIFSGGTASGKTTMLGVCLPFIQPNHRMISIEDTRELRAPNFLHWVPLTTREQNPEGKGEISMLDLLVNSLRMRPDRIVVGEIRREREAEVMFEAMHTGHSVYTTVHANTAEETVRRLTSPPINIPVQMIDSIHLNAVMFRNRRLGTRRVLQLSEYILEKRGAEEERIKSNVIYRWKASDDTISKHSESIRFFDELGLHTGLSKYEIEQELNEKKEILKWMAGQNISNVNDVGKVIAEYYVDPDGIFDMAKKNKKFGL